MEKEYINTIYVIAGMWLLRIIYFFLATAIDDYKLFGGMPFKEIIKDLKASPAKFFRDYILFPFRD
ncbi:TPA: hypothetical protein DEP94_02185 [Candidatus Nomurabacteria bacterium]|nr:hypothetical protein [Candidatus Nomurabacteria bacterium]